MASQSLLMQLLRMVLALAFVLVVVNQCDPLLDAFASQAMGSGCHSDAGDSHHRQHHHQH